ncbi:unnamed protein product [Acanthoscelides obtectus]|uniref:Chitin-binding type-2 domain-containing protein n=1 Tax=Acanthoscelides obtectus TaxID=200917 RepID=A0A9P0JV31_ACAOB|nr:unnamed protein product [Acanthoscelides obtectus]CAK1627895.1 hypothetical protein AOBTE_LOCUS4889 [Acanthoscelides obtectus]
MTCFYKLSFVSGVTLGQRKYSRNVETTVVKTGVNFDCPEEFGYYPHPNDCTQYYVCVFGGALLESCTGGLMYSHELQTCDWPRNVGCEGVELGAASSSASASSSSSAAPSAPSRGRERDRERDRDGVRERESQRENNRDDRRRFTPPPPPQPQAVVTSRGQPRQLHHSQQEIIKQQQQQQLYEDAEEVLPPAEEVENDRQQRVYRGQPSTVGQVQRDRDGLRNANVIPTYTGRGEKIGVISFGTQNNQHYSDESSVAPPKAVPTATPTSARTVYNNSQYTNNQHEPYYALYDDVDLYRDAEYSLNNYNQANTQRTQTPAYRGTPAPVAQTTAVREDTSKRGNTVYLQQNSYPQDTYQQSTVADYNDNRYDTQVTDDQAIYRQSNRQSPPSLRDDRNELNDVEDDIPKRTTNTRKPITTTIRTTTTTTTTPRTNPSKKSTQPLSRTNNRGRGSAHYGGAGTQITNNEVTFNTNRGTPAPRSRPTLKPTTSIVSKSQEYVDIYRYPPRRPSPIYPQPQPDKTAAKCRKDVCLLPDCSCGGRDIPGDIPVEETPQMVLMTFDDAVNDLNKNYYIDLFENNRKNPNGCPIAATFYVSHEWTDYSQVQNLYADGHEMASHTVSHSFGEQFSQKKWTREVAGQREILSAYGGVKLEDVRGMRAPFLSVGGNKMFKMLYDSNFTYDSSMPIYENKPPSWPYTLDYKLFHDCMIPPCPTRSYPGVWEVPMVMWQDLNGGRCSMGDACSNPPDSEGVYKMLMKNFQRHYTTNRAPFGLFYHAAWFTQPHHKEGFINFIDSILTMKDVWLVTNWQAIQWVRDPTPISRMNNYEPFQCNYSDRPKRCNNPKVCNLWHKSGVRYMRTCQPCPDIYPWTGNTGIRSSKIDNDIED